MRKTSLPFSRHELEIIEAMDRDIPLVDTTIYEDLKSKQLDLIGLVVLSSVGDNVN
jgi:hypothetical protein